MNSQEFKLLAIRPLEGCGIKFLKILEKGTIYKFYKEYAFWNSSGNEVINGFEEISSITFDPLLPSNLYDVKKGLNVNISAIVGKNGSGKSSIIDLLVASVNQLAVKLKGNLLNTTAEIISTTEGAFIEYKIHCEIYYKIDNNFYVLKIDDTDIELKNISSNQPIDFELRNFFYTQIISFSIYAYNSWDMGDWIDELFHKNDSYQIPIVVTPKREHKSDGLAGIININNEHYLLHQRLMSIILSNPDYKLTENLSAKYIGLSFKKAKEFFVIDEHNDEITLNKTKESQIEFFYRLLKSDNFAMMFENSQIMVFKSKVLLYKFKQAFEIKDINLPVDIQYKTDVYILYKIISICSKYLSYNKFLKKYEGNDKGWYIIDVDKFIEAVKTRNSHITLKLQQIINFVKNFPDVWKGYIKKDEIDTNRLSEKLLNKVDVNTPLIELLPPPIFDISFLSKNRVNILEVISSGEKQLIHTISTALYHLSNLDSVQEDEKIVKYKNVNIIFDEIELYFHPEFQRQFVSRLLYDINSLNLTSIKGINILIVSHSPFILSDIPACNILKLKNGNIIDLDKKTFGANIHDLLEDSFFLEDGFMGEFAKTVIQDIANYLNDSNNYEIIWTWNEENSLQLIKQIGEPILKSHLQSMYDIKFKDDAEIKNEIERLQNILDRK